MATHTTTGGAKFGRNFSISRENGQTNKEGTPYFFEWLKELPTGESAKGRKFESRQKPGGTSHYELFKALDGYLIDVRKEQKDFGGGEETHLFLHMIDAGDEYILDMGKMDSRYTTDVLKRILNPFFSPNQKLRVSPYAGTDERGKSSIGISAYSGADKLAYSQSSDFLQAMPPARTWEGRNNKTEYDFTNVGEWLFEQVQRLVVPHLTKDPISAPQSRPQTAAPPPTRL